jgi:hypothetical protein
MSAQPSDLLNINFIQLILGQGPAERRRPAANRKSAIGESHAPMDLGLLPMRPYPTPSSNRKDIINPVPVKLEGMSRLTNPF